MTAVLSLIRLRGATLARVAATVLVLLTVSPFTAPFPTCDLADLGSDTPAHGDLLSSAKTVKDTSALHITDARGMPLSLVKSLLADPHIGGEETRPLPQLVLRL